MASGWEYAGGIGNALIGTGTVMGAMQGYQGGSTGGLKPKPFLGPISTPGYFLGGGQLRLTSPDILNQERSLQQRLQGLAATVAPGMSQQRAALGQMFGAAKQQALGTLRSNLAQRGLLGWSFGQDQMRQLESQYNLDQANAMRETYNNEFTATFQTLQAEAGLKQEQAQRQIAELQIAGNYLSTVKQLDSTVTRGLAEMAAEQAVIAAGGDPSQVPSTFNNYADLTPNSGTSYPAAQGLGTMNTGTPRSAGLRQPQLPQTGFVKRSLQ